MWAPKMIEKQVWCTKDNTVIIDCEPWGTTIKKYFKKFLWHSVV